jgi:hypothetical protein
MLSKAVIRDKRTPHQLQIEVDIDTDRKIAHRTARGRDPFHQGGDESTAEALGGKTTRTV